MRQAHAEMSSAAIDGMCQPRRVTIYPLVASIRKFARDPVNVALLCVFAPMAVLYVWRAAQVAPLTLHGGSTGQYNALADAIIHFHLWIAHFPSSLVQPESLHPYRPSALLRPFGDDSVYNGNVYLTWGPTTALALVPLHLLGFEPSPSVVIAPFAVVGLGLALAILRVCLRSLMPVPLWMCLLSALVLGCASLMLFLLQGSNVYQESIVTGYCFTMAGAYLAVSALACGKASLCRLGLISLCFGLACGSRVPFYCTIVLLVPVFLALKGTRGTRQLLVALIGPVSVCVVLLAVYNLIRYGSLLETGERHVINSLEVFPRSISSIPVGMWAYLLTPPRITATFPFVFLTTPQFSYPFAIPHDYVRYSDVTGGVLSTAPIACFVIALPSLSRRRLTLFASLGPLLITMVVTGFCMMLFTAYVIPVTTERYEGEYVTLFSLAGLVVWLALSGGASGWRRRLVRISGGALAVWSCVAGLAIGSDGLQSHLGIWHALVHIASPVSTAIATAAGHPILTEVWAPTIAESHEPYGLSAGPSTIWLSGEEQARMTVASPDARTVTIAAEVTPSVALGVGSALVAHVGGPGSSDATYHVPADNKLRIDVHVHRGINEVSLGPVYVVGVGSSAVSPEFERFAILTNVHMVGS